MPRLSPEDRYRENLATLLLNPEIVQRFGELESMTVDELAVATDKKHILELVRQLKVIRSFKTGVANAPQLREYRDHLREQRQGREEAQRPASRRRAQRDNPGGDD